MPTYQYRCTECDNSLEVVQKFADDPLTSCPSCQGRLRKVFSPVGVVFKGSGFYKTDSRSAGKRGDDQRDAKTVETPVKTGDGTSAAASDGAKSDSAKSDSAKSDSAKSDSAASGKSTSDGSRSGDAASRRSTADRSGSDSSPAGGRDGSSSGSNGSAGASKTSKDPVHKVA